MHLGNLLFVQKQFAVAAHVMIVVASKEIFGNIHVLQPHLAILNITEGVDKTRLAKAYRFDFGAGEHNAGCEAFDNLIIECRPAILYIYVTISHLLITNN